MTNPYIDSRADADVIGGGDNIFQDTQVKTCSEATIVGVSPCMLP
jgi:hypothetical protein